MINSKSLNSIALTRGQLLWLLRDVLDLAEGTDTAFVAYLKFLRRNGVPFAPGETPGGPGTNVIYHYHHIMEVVLALTLRRQAILKGDAVKLLVQMRDELRPLFKKAWLERESGLGASVSVSIDDGKSLKTSGLWLDLGLNYTEQDVLTTMGPKLLGPKKAIQHLCTRNLQSQFRDPIKISDLAAQVVKAAPNAPEVHRGRQ
jgi:hypothetical protein